VIFDASSQTFRNDIYDQYKANRSETPEDLIPQFPLVRDATRAFGSPSIEMHGFEADDLIATYAKQAEALGARVTIISSDKDLMQLVSDKVRMLDTMKNKDIGIEQVIEKFGMPPENVIDIQALAGDSVDNIPGVPGIGVKTAALLVLFDFLELMTFRTLTARVRAQLGEGATEGLRRDDDAAKALAPAERNAPENVIFDKEKYVCVQDVDILKNWVKRGFEMGVIAVDLETNSLDSAAAKMVGICLAVDDNEACYIPLTHVGEGGAGGDMFGGDAPKQIPMDEAQRYDLYPAPYDDTMLISYALGTGLHNHGMDALCEMHFGHKPIAFKEIAGTGKSQKTFDQIALDGKKTKTGAWKTGVDILETLADEGQALPRVILDWRGYSKLKSTYSDALVNQINADTGRVHTSFSLAATTTGRLSSSDPNLQNIPIRTEEGRKIRDAFVAEKGHVLVAADYSQIELRILAHVAQLDTMKQAFADGVDIHALTASEMFNVPLDEMTSEIRRNAKAINFGIIYGISAFGLAKNIGISRTEAGDYIKTYFEKFPGIKSYMEDTKAFSLLKGHECCYKCMMNSCSKCQGITQTL